MRRVMPYAMAMEKHRGIADMIGVTRSAALDEYGRVEGGVRALERAARDCGPEGCAVRERTL